MPIVNIGYQTQGSDRVISTARQIEVAMRNIEAESYRAGVSLDSTLGKIDSFGAKLAGLAGISLSGWGIVNQIKNVRSEFQNTEAMFKVFLGSAQKAQSFMSQLQSYAFNNVFDFSNLAKQSAQLLAYGTAQDKVIDKLDRLSNVAAGVNAPLGELVAVYNKVKSTNEIDKRVEMSLSQKGIRIRDILEQARGLDKGALANVKLNFQDLDKAIEAATSEGGMYFGMMEEKMKTLGDSLGLLQDSVTNFMNNLGKNYEGSLKGIITNLSDFVDEFGDNHEGMVNALGAIISSVEWLTSSLDGLFSTFVAVSAEYGAAKALLATSNIFDKLTEDATNYKDALDKVLDVMENGVVIDKNMPTAEKEDLIRLNKQGKLDFNVVQEINERIEAMQAEYVQCLKEGKVKEANSKIEKIMGEEKVKTNLITANATRISEANTKSTKLNTAAQIVAKNAEKQNIATGIVSLRQLDWKTFKTAAATQATNVYTGAIIRARKAEQALAASMLTNPLGWITGAIVAVAAIGTAIIKLNKTTDYAAIAQGKLDDAMEVAKSQADDEKRSLDELVGVMRHAEKGTDTYNNAKKKLINDFQQYNSGIHSEIDDILSLGDAYKGLAKSIQDAANARAREALRSDLSNNIAEDRKNMMSDIRDKLIKNNIDGKDIGVIADIVRAFVNDAVTIDTFGKDGEKVTRKNVTEQFEKFFENNKDIVGDISFSEFKKMTGNYGDISSKMEDFIKKNARNMQVMRELYVDLPGEEPTKDEEKKIRNALNLASAIESARISALDAFQKYQSDTSDENYKAWKTQESTLKEAQKKYKETLGVDYFGQYSTEDKYRKRLSEANIGFSTAQETIDKADAAKKTIEERGTTLEQLKEETQYADDWIKRYNKEIDDLQSKLEEVENATDANYGEAQGNIALITHYEEEIRKKRLYILQNQEKINKNNSLISSIEAEEGAIASAAEYEKKQDNAKKIVDLIDEIHKAEEDLANARVLYGEKNTEQNKKAVEDGEKTVTTLLAQFKKLTIDEDKLPEGENLYRTREDVEKSVRSLRVQVSQLQKIGMANLSPIEQAILQDKSVLLENEQNILKGYNVEIIYDKSRNELLAQRQQLLNRIATTEDNIKSGIADDGARADLDNYNQQLKEVNATLKLMGGDTLEAMEKSILAANNAITDLMNSNIKDEFAKLNAQYAKTIRDLDEQQKEYVKKNGRRDASIEIKKKEAELKLDIDKNRLTTQFAEWKKSMERENSAIKLDMEIAQSQFLKDISKSGSEYAARTYLVQYYEMQKLSEELEKQRDNELNNRFSKDVMDAIRANKDARTYINSLTGETNEITEETANQILEAVAKYDEKIEFTKEQKQQEFDLNLSRDAYETYYTAGENLGTYESFLHNKLEIDKKYSLAIDHLAGERRKAEEKGDVNAIKEFDRMMKTLEQGRQEEYRKIETESLGSLKTALKNVYGETLSVSDVIGKSGVVSLGKLSKGIKDFTKGGKEAEDAVKSISSVLGVSEEEVQEILKNSGQLLALTNETKDASNEAIGGIFDEVAKNPIGDIVQSVGTAVKGFKDLEKATTAEEKAQVALAATCNSVGGVLTSLTSIMNQFAEISDNPKIQESADIIGGIGQNLISAGQGAAAGGWIGAIVGGVTDALGQIMNAILQNVSAAAIAKQKTDEYTLSLKELSYEMSEFDKASVFGYSDRDELVESFEKRNTALGNIAETYKSLSSDINEVNFDKFFTMWEDSRFSASVLIADAAIGNLIGLIQHGIDAGKKFKAFKQEFEGSFFETLVGGFSRFGKNNVEGFQRAIEKGYSAIEALQVKVVDKAGNSKDKYMSLKDLAPDIFNEDGSINTKQLDNFLSVYGGSITQAQKLLLEDLKTDTEAYNEYMDSITEYYSKYFGDMGNSISSSFENAFRNGEDALDSFTQSMETSIEKWVSSIAYAATIQPILDQANKMVTDAVQNGSMEDADKAMEDAISLVFDNYDSMYSKYTEYLEEAKSKYNDLYGVDLYSDYDAEGSRGFGQMTQDTAEALNARFTALQIEGANVVAVMQAVQPVIMEIGSQIELHTMSINQLLLNSNIALQMAQSQIDQLQIIAENTSALAETNDILSGIRQNTSKL